MPIPELNEDGVLPVGIYDCTLEEIGERFGRFRTTDRRVRLYERLRELVDEEQKAGLAIELIVDRSFATDKANPSDIDLVIVLPKDYNLNVEMSPFCYNAISKRDIRRRYRFDAIALRNQSDRYFEWVGFYQKIKGSDQRKGILRIKL
jgi:predicted nucleotidyltransferase